MISAVSIDTRYLFNRLYEHISKEITVWKSISSHGCIRGISHPARDRSGLRFRHHNPRDPITQAHCSRYSSYNFRAFAQSYSPLGPEVAYQPGLLYNRRVTGLEQFPSVLHSGLIFRLLPCRCPGASRSDPTKNESSGGSDYRSPARRLSASSRPRPFFHNSSDYVWAWKNLVDGDDAP